MKTIRERELKLDVDPGFTLPEVGGRPIPPRTFTSTYFDTPEHRLLRSGITLRRRVENRKGVWQLKLPSDVGRFELEAPGGPAPPRAFLDLLVALLRHSELTPVAKLRTRRAGVAVGPRPDRIEVVVDTVASLDGARVLSSFVEVEAEVVKGEGAQLGAIGKALRKAGARPSAGQPKLTRVLSVETQAPTEDGGPIGRLRELLLEQYETMLANDPGVRLGKDIEALHQLRVATRRSRALLRAARGLVAAEWAEPLRRELAWLGGLLGPVRDADVLLEHLDSEGVALEGDDARAFRRLRARLAAERNDGRAALLEAMGSTRYFELLDRLEGVSTAPAGDDARPLADIAAAEFASLRQAVKALPKRPTDDELHNVRIHTKRARYAAELASPELGKRGAKLVERAKEVQDVIGEHQDAFVAEERLRAMALRGGGKTGLTAGRLIERQHQRKRAARKAFPDAWRRLDKARRGAFG